MIKINQKNYAPKKKPSLGTTSSEKKEDDFVSESGIPMHNMPGTQMGTIPLSVDFSPVFTDISFNSSQFFPLYKDMYYFDPVAGSAVDLMSTLPFSEFTIGGMDKRYAHIYKENVERLSLRSIFQELSIDYLVTGTFTGSLLYNKEKKIFFDIITHDIENLDILETPFYGQEPIITAKFDPKVRQLLSKNSKRVENMKKRLGPSLVEKLMSGSLELDPLSTIYIPRKTFTQGTGISWYRRILPLYLIEKNLYRGTLVESSRRQRGIMHLNIGDGAEWEPTPEDMESITDLFLNADSDPLGAIIATRLGVQVDEVRCLAGSTWIETEEGFKQIQDLVDHDPNAISKKKYSLNIKVKNEKGDFVPTKSWMYQGRQKVFEISTYQDKVESTKNHRWLVLREANLDLIKTKNLKVGDFLLKPKKGERISKEILKFFIRKYSKKNAVLNNIECLDYSNSFFNEIVLEIVKNIDKKFYKVLKFFIETQMDFQKIESIEEKEKKHVYDLEIDLSKTENPLFLANGFVSKNSGGDFWKVTDIWDTTTQFKLRALGISESFLSGDSSWSTMETSLTVFIENLKAYRDRLTRKVFYEKIFPLISLVHGLTVNKSGKVVQDPSIINKPLEDIYDRIQDESSLLIPTVHWAKQLKPEGDVNYLDIIQRMTEQGVPVPLRALAAAGGFNLDELINQQDEDIETRTKVSEYMKKINELKNEQGGEGGGAGMGYYSATPFEEVNDRDFQTLDQENAAKALASNNLGKGRSAVLGENPRPTFDDRDFGEASEIKGRTKTGKPRHIIRQKQANDKVNEAIAKAAMNLKEKIYQPSTTPKKDDNLP